MDPAVAAAWRHAGTHCPVKEQALAWFEAEHRVLIAALTAAARAGFDACAWQLAWAMGNFLDWRGYWQEWAATQRIALAAATRMDDLAGQATAARLLGHTWARLGDYDQARAQLTGSLELYQRLGDRGQGRVHQTLGWLAERQGRNEDALGHADQALALYQATGDQDRLAAALNNVGWCHALLGNYQRSREFTQQALAAYRRDRQPAWRGQHLGQSLGNAEHNLGNLAAAKECYQNALAIVTALGNRYDRAEVPSSTSATCSGPPGTMPQPGTPGRTPWPSWRSCTTPTRSRSGPG